MKKLETKTFNSLQRYFIIDKILNTSSSQEANFLLYRPDRLFPQSKKALSARVSNFSPYLTVNGTKLPLFC